MKRKPKAPKRMRTAIRAAAREQGGPIYVAEAKTEFGRSVKPARLLNLGDAGPYLEGVPVLPSSRRKPLAASDEGDPVSREDHAFGDVSDELARHDAVLGEAAP